MYNPAAVRGAGQVPMQPPIHCQSDVVAKERLAQYVFEYLHHTGASKTAECFKEEVLSTMPNLSSLKAPEKAPPSFLLDWWTLFWDLYCAAPERREMNEHSSDARYFHDNFIGGSFPMNGGPPFGAPGMMPGPEGMMGVHPGAPGFGRFPPHARMPPAGMPPGSFGMFSGDPRMARMQPTTMRMPPGGGFPGGAPGPMRPGAPGAQAAMPPGMRYAFMDQPGQSFPPGASGIMPNGGVMPLSMSSPGMPGGPGPSDAHGPGGGPPPFMPLGGMPTSSSAMPFGMGDTTVSMGNGTPTTTSEGLPPSSGASSQPALAAATSLINGGDEMKASPATTPRGAGVAGGTPAPGSAQSGVNSQAPVTPLSNAAAQQPPPDLQKDDKSEISKIREGLLDGFLKEEPDTHFFS